MKKIFFVIAFLLFSCVFLFGNNTTVSALNNEEQTSLPDIIAYQADGLTMEQMYLSSRSFITFEYQDLFDMGYTSVTLIALAVEEGYYTHLQITFTEYGLLYSEYSGMTIEWYCGYMGDYVDAAIWAYPDDFVGTPHIIQVSASTR